MNFFEHQERARRNTWLLGFYFLTAVVLIVAAVDVVVCLALLGRISLEGGSWKAPGFARTVLLWTTGGTAGVILLGSLFKIAALSGGRSIAASMGGILVQPGTPDLAERRLVNLVEEMSLASGIPPPFLYVLPEQGINAFAAGTSPNTSSVAVSRGALESLNREELQGVVAHEFSHIFNGDMRINLRLIGILHGILLIALIGRGALRGGSRPRRGKNSGGAALVGLGLVAIGYIGVFFAQLIKSAISRQREFLADASAVQFTRNPSGILGALVKIRDGGGSHLAAARTEEVSHLLFAQGLSSFFATHPPLDARIRAIDPGRLLEEALRSPAKASPAAPAAEAAAFAPPSAAPLIALEAVGSLPAESLAASARMLEKVPAELREKMSGPPGARAAVYASLLARDEDLRRRQGLSLGEEAPAAEACRLLLGGTSRLTVLELSIPALRALPSDGREAFLDRVHALVMEDNRIEPSEALAEVFLRRVLAERLSAAHGGSLRREILVVLSFLARAGHPGRPEEASASFARGLNALDPGLRGAVLPELESGPEELRSALERLSSAGVEARQRVMASCAACALSDQRVTEGEWEALRVLGGTLECPVPAAVAGITVASS